MTNAPEPPSGEQARQAIHAIRGYEYQTLAAALAWVDLDENGRLYLEVAEDYAQVIGDALNAVQVKDTGSSGSVTLNTPAVRDAISSFVKLFDGHADQQVELRFFTSSPVGREKAAKDRPAGHAGIDFWKRVKAGRDEVGPLRDFLEGESFPKGVREFCKSRDDEGLRRDLICRITWDCDQPDATNLRLELEQRLTLVLRRDFRIHSQEARGVADALVFWVLQKSTLPTARDRVLSRPEFCALVDHSTRTWIRNTDLERLVAQASDGRGASDGGEAEIGHPDRDARPWIIDLSSVPEPRALVPRPSVTAGVEACLKSSGICFIVGATGTGKSMVARSVASAFAHGAYWIDLRDNDAREASSRLSQGIPLLVDMSPAMLMLEDLNCLVDSTVLPLLAQVVEAARRHDMRLLITSYQPPSVNILNGLGVDSTSIVTCPRFDQGETNALVALLGGDPATWGGVAQIVGGSGHPQLTHAFLAGMAAKGWPAEEIGQLFERGFRTAGVDDARAAARASVAHSLREPSRDLLYRLSLITGFFKRSLVPEIAAVPPRIDRASECFDDLLGRWVEVATTDRHRISPLASRFGVDMLATRAQRQVHHAIATHVTSHSPIDAEDVDGILVHGLAGEADESLLQLSSAIAAAALETREALATQVAMFRMLDTSKPIYPKNLPTSVMLRVAQFRLAVASDKPANIEEIVDALLREVDEADRDSPGPYLQGAVIVPILTSLGIANHVPGWVSLLSRFRRMEVDDNEDARVLRDEHPDIRPTPTLFHIGVSGLDSVRKLEAIFEDLDGWDSDDRRELFAPIDPVYADHHLTVNGAWVVESRGADFDPSKAVASYRRMADYAQTWGLRTLSLQCCVAVATILEEHLDDHEAALRVLSETEATFGQDRVLSRALAKLHYRGGQRLEALSNYRDAVKDVDGSGPVEAVHTLRDAAVCSAECGEWETARTWFLRAQKASGPLEEIGLGAIRIGLGADAAVASFELEDLEGALGLLKEALLALAEVDPNSSLQAAYCHRLVRQTILWLNARSEGSTGRSAHRPTPVPPGSCSNPEPVPEIQEYPIGHVGLFWYFLAEIEVAAGLDLGIRDIAMQGTADGHVPLLEHGLRSQLLGVAIQRLDPESFAAHLPNYVASAVYCLANRDRLGDTLSPAGLGRAVIPSIPIDGPFDQTTEHSARHAILAYVVKSLLDGQPDRIPKLRAALTDGLSHSYAGTGLFDLLNDGDGGLADLDGEVTVMVARCLESETPPPELLFRAGIRLVDWIAGSSFKSVLSPRLAPWLRRHWERVLRTQRALLFAPRATVPAIQHVLESRLEGTQFGARLALVATAAVRVRVDDLVLQRLTELASASAE